MARIPWMIASLMAVLGLAGGAARAETLTEALAAAYAYSPSLAASRAQLRATDEGVSQALGTWRPTVTLNADAGNQEVTSNANPPALKYHLYTAARDGTFRVAQPLYEGGLSPARTAQAESLVQAQRATLRATEASVLLAAATAYMDVLRDQEILKIHVENEQNIRAMADASRERFQEGELSSTDIAQADARLALAAAQRVSAEGALADSRSRFEAAVGHVPERLELPPPPPPAAADFTEVRTAALARNPNVVAADETAQAAKKAVDVAAAALLPKLQLVAQRTKNWNQSYIDSYSRIDQLMLNVSVPLYSQGIDYSNVRQRKETAAQNRLQADQARLDAVQSARQAWNARNTTRRNVLLYADQQTFSQNAVAGVEEEEAIGSRTIIEVLNAKQELVTARVNLAQAIRDEVVADFQLRSVVGELSAEALDLPVERYDPEKHYLDVRDKWVGTGATD